ncbi:hypothetical protein LCGC14_1442520 [marine sediment metagenome]|uniref:Uncharacterized protein n=1 Tax=marine sediment metagenome TaxID=412755 RepID=A0A0F9J7A6_9ZZZZ
MFLIRDPDEVCDLCSRKNSGDNLRYFQNLLPNPRVIITLCVRCSLRAWITLTYFHVADRDEIKPTRKYKKRERKYKKRKIKEKRKMGRVKGRKKPTDLFCADCLEEVTIVALFEYFCEGCIRRYKRAQVLTFNEMIEAKFERVKHRNLNQLKRDMRP